VLDDFLSEHFLAAPIFTIAEEGGDPVSVADGIDIDRAELRWGSLIGWKSSWFGHAYEWCAASDGDIRIITNQSAQMHRNTDRWSVGATSTLNCRIVVNYAAFMKLIRPIVADAAGFEYILGVNREDVEVGWAVYWDGFSRLKFLRLEGTVVDDGVSFSGFLDGPGDE